MPKFQYSAINQQGKNLNGIINATTPEIARHKLKSLKLTIIGIDEISETTEIGNEKSKYKFEARNKEAKKVIGSIEADSILGAFKRLINEYELNVIKLSSLNASDAEFETSIPQVKGFYKQVQQLKSNLENDHSKEEYFEQKKQEEFRKTIEEITLVLRTILAEYHDDMNPKSQDFILKYTEHLDKIKFSKNYDSIIASSNKILQYFQNTILYLDSSKDAKDKLGLKLDLMQKIGNLKRLGKTSHQKNKIKETIQKIGLELPVKKEGTGALQKILNELNIIFNSQANSLTKTLALKDIFKNTKQYFIRLFTKKEIEKTQKQSTSKTQKQEIFKFSKTEENLRLLSFLLLSIYLIFYFFSVFLSEKILKIELLQIFYIYQESFLIYFICSIILLHSAISLRFYMIKHKIKHSNVSYLLFGLLSCLILINL